MCCLIKKFYSSIWQLVLALPNAKSHSTWRLHNVQKARQKLQNHSQCSNLVKWVEIALVSFSIAKQSAEEFLSRFFQCRDQNKRPEIKFKSKENKTLHDKANERYHHIHHIHHIYVHTYVHTEHALSSNLGFVSTMYYVLIPLFGFNCVVIFVAVLIALPCLFVVQMVQYIHICILHTQKIVYVLAAIKLRLVKFQINKVRLSIINISFNKHIY